MMLFDDDFDFDDDDGMDYDDSPYPPKTDQGDYGSGDSSLSGLIIMVVIGIILLMGIFGP